MLADLLHATRHSVVRQFEIGGFGQPIESRHGFLYAWREVVGAFWCPIELLNAARHQVALSE